MTSDTMVRRDVTVRHDAKYSEEVLELFRELFPRLDGWIVDPFAGVGRIFEVDEARDRIMGIELEPEFAYAHPWIKCGDALDPGSYPAHPQHIVTSITYGNRFAGAWVGVDCGECEGRGRTGSTVCPECEGRGNDSKDRFGYAASLNRAPSEGSSALWTFGKKWRAFHFHWLELLAQRILEPGADRLVLNVSNHMKTLPATKTRDKGEVEVPVCEFMVDAALHVGFDLVEEYEVSTRRMGKGQNRDARAGAERVYVFDLLGRTQRADRYAAQWFE